MENVLKISNLKKTYNTKDTYSKLVLNDINLEVKKGEFIGIMGASGSGKTTFLNIVSGMLNSTSGIVEINNKNISKLNEDELTTFRRSNIGFVFQGFNLLDSLTIKENIMLPMVLEGKKINEINSKVCKILRLLNITDIMDKYPYETSGGQQQRGAIGRSLINEPSIVFADEPTGNLDSESAGIVMDTFKKLNDEENTTILLVTHDPFTASYCKKIVFLKDGYIINSIEKNESRESFFYDILNNLSKIGGGKSDLQKFCD